MQLLTPVEIPGKPRFLTIARSLGCGAVAVLFSASMLTNPFIVFADQAPAGCPTCQGAAAGSEQPALIPSSTTPNPVMAAKPAALTVTLKDGLKAGRQVTTSGPTVADALKDANIALAPLDRTTPAPAVLLTPATQIVVTRVHTEMQIEHAVLPFKTVFKMSHDVAPGHITKGHTGAPGILTKTFQLSYVNDKMTSRKLVSRKVTKAPVDQETLGGIRVREARALPSRAGTYNRLRCLSMTATGYSPYEGSSAGRCATGMRAGYGVVAVDPRVVRLGTKLYIEGYGYAVAGDTGGAIKGRRIDLGHTTYREAANVGRRHVKVWILSPSR